MPLVFDVIEEADGGGVMGCDSGGVCVEAVDPAVGVAVAAFCAAPEALFELVGKSSELRSIVTLRTAPTRSLAIRDHDSIRLWASQHAAGPKPLIICENILANYGLFS